MDKNPLKDSAEYNVHIGHTIYVQFHCFGPFQEIVYP